MGKLTEAQKEIVRLQDTAYKRGCDNMATTLLESMNTIKQQGYGEIEINAVIHLIEHCRKTSQEFDAEEIMEAHAAGVQ